MLDTSGSSSSLYTNSIRKYNSVTMSPTLRLLRQIWREVADPLNKVSENTTMASLFYSVTISKLFDRDDKARKMFEKSGIVERVRYIVSTLHLIFDGYDEKQIHILSIFYSGWNITLNYFSNLAIAVCDSFKKTVGTEKFTTRLSKKLTKEIYNFGFNILEYYQKVEEGLVWNIFKQKGTHWILTSCKINTKFFILYKNMDMKKITLEIPIQNILLVETIDDERAGEKETDFCFVILTSKQPPKYFCVEEQTNLNAITNHLKLVMDNIKKRNTDEETPKSTSLKKSSKQKPVITDFSPKELYHWMIRLPLIDNDLPKRFLLEKFDGKNMLRIGETEILTRFKISHHDHTVLKHAFDVAVLNSTYSKIGTIPRKSWDKQKLADWIDKVTSTKYGKEFRRHSIDGEVFPHLNGADYEELGVSSSDAQLFGALQNCQMATCKSSCPSLWSVNHVITWIEYVLSQASSTTSSVPKMSLEMRLVYYKFVVEREELDGKALKVISVTDLVSLNFDIDDAKILVSLAEKLPFCCV